MNIKKQQISRRLMELADEKYRAFHAGLCPGTKNILGVRVPVLRKFAKELYAAYGIEALPQIGTGFYEEIMLQGMLIGMERAWRPDLILGFLPKIDNWAVCDVFCGGLKITKKHREEMLSIIRQCLESTRPFTVRFGIVMLLSYYAEAAYLPVLFKAFDGVSQTDYYVQMAVAWAISVCLVKFFDETVCYLQSCRLDRFTFNKALQKGIESYRLTAPQKALLRSMKK